MAAASALVVACQQMPGARSSQVRQPPAMPAAPAPEQLSVTPVTQGANAAIVEFRLAQNERDKGLQSLKVGDRELWVLPQPVMTRVDLQSVAAVKTQEGRPFVRLQFTQAGAQKLAAVSQRFTGKYLLLSINGQLASAPTIGGAMNQGLLFIPTASEQQASDVAAAIVTPMAPAAQRPAPTAQQLAPAAQRPAAGAARPAR
jgi:preprotein translocase subunit SecD